MASLRDSVKDSLVEAARLRHHVRGIEGHLVRGVVVVARGRCQHVSPIVAVGSVTLENILLVFSRNGGRLVVRIPCRHPERVRPSLEACGFDLCRTTESLMGIPLRWSTDGRLPEYLTLVSGFFHNADAIDLKAVWQALKP